MGSKRLVSRKRTSPKTAEHSSPTNARWIIGLCVAIAAISLAAAIYTSKTLLTSMGTLSDRESQLQLLDQEASESFDEWCDQFELFLVKVARQAQPVRDLATPKSDYQRVFSRFIENKHYGDTFPARTASAYYRLGQLRMLDGNYQAAIDALQTSIAIAKHQSFDEQAALSRNTLGCVFAAVGDYQAAYEQLHAGLSDACDSAVSSNSIAIAYRNIGIIQQIKGTSGTDAVCESIRLLSENVADPEVSVSRELLIDSYMTLCDMYWAQEKFAESSDACQKARELLQSLLTQVQDSTLDSDFAAINRYLNAIRFTDRNLKSLETLRLGRGKDSSLSRTTVFQWQRLVNLATEIVPGGASMEATMYAEFEKQTGLALAWGMFDWTHDVVTEIVLRTYDRLQLVILVDNDESLDEAKSSLVCAGVPLDRIRFSVCNYETPWFRDVGPIVGKTSSGDWVWFDACLTRESANGRDVTDALPTIIRRNWAARVVQTRLDVEGGSVLSNGKGLTVCSSKVFTFNREFGFSDAAIDREMRRITGARKLAVVTPLVDESTGHVDMFTTFANANTVVVGQIADSTDPNQRLLDLNARELKLAGADQKLSVVRVPMPERIGSVFRTYTNVIYANGVLLVPSYSDPLDEEARKIYQRLMPDWRVELIECSKLVTKGGALHCLVTNLGNTPYTPMPVRIRGRASKEANPKS